MWLQTSIAYFRHPPWACCPHAVCSACIRSSLEYQERNGAPFCPSCKTKCDGRNLQPNLQLRDVVEKYRGARSVLLSLVQTGLEARDRPEGSPQVAAESDAQASPRHDSHADEPAPPRRLRSAAKAADGATGRIPRSSSAPAATSGRKPPQRAQPTRQGRKRSATDDAEGSDISENLTDSPAASKKPKRDPDFEIVISDSAESDSDSEGLASDYSPPEKPSKAQAAAKKDKPSTALPKGHVLCPICSHSVPAFYINTHVNSCLDQPKPTTAKAGATRGCSNAQAWCFQLPAHDQTHPVHVTRIQGLASRVQGATAAARVPPPRRAMMGAGLACSVLCSPLPSWR